MSKEHDIYIVDWLDSSSSSEWLLESEIDGACELAKCQSVGFFVKESKETISLALSCDYTKNHATFGQIITIPKVSITKKKCLRKT